MPSNPEAFFLDQPFTTRGLGRAGICGLTPSEDFFEAVAKLGPMKPFGPVAPRRSKKRRSAPKAPGYSFRERQVALGICLGLSVTDVARALGIRRNTVSATLCHIRRDRNVRSLRLIDLAIALNAATADLLAYKSRYPVGRTIS